MFGKKNKDDILKPKSQKTPNLKKLEDLYYAAEDARQHAYAPYSDFKVGAALLVRPNEDSVMPINKIYTGVNIENGSYGATLCAERVAFAKAISAGVLEYDIGQNPFIAIAVSAGEEEALPCGICRQFMSEFAPELIVVTKSEGQIRIRNLAQLLPESFQLNKEEKFAIQAEIAAQAAAGPEEAAEEATAGEAAVEAAEEATAEIVEEPDAEADAEESAEEAAEEPDAEAPEKTEE